MYSLLNLVLLGLPVLLSAVSSLGLTQGQARIREKYGAVPVFFPRYPVRVIKKLGPRSTASDSHNVKRQSNATLTAMPAQMILSQAAKSAWNDAAAIAQIKAQGASDLSPVYSNIILQGDLAWALVQDANNETFYLSSTASPNGTAAAIWAYPQAITSKTDNTSTAVHVQVGSYSPNGGIGGLSSHVVEGLTGATEIITVALGVIRWLRTYTSTVTESATMDEAALTAEAQGGEVASEVGGAVGEDVAVDLVASGAAFPVGTVAVAVFLGVAFAVEVMYKTFTLTVNIYNFDPKHSYTVAQEYGNNEKISGGDWQALTLAPMSTTIPGPFGPQPALENVAEYATYIFVNVDKVLNGLYTAMSVNASNGPQFGFMLGYELHAVLQNQISMSNGFTDAEKWLNETDWHTTNNITFAGNNGLAITGYTPALKGAEGNAYSFDVSIGSPV